MDQPPQPNPKCKDRDRVPYSQGSAAHARRNSTAYTGSGSSPVAAGKGQQRQVTDPHSGSRATESHTMAYDVDTRLRQSSMQSSLSPEPAQIPSDDDIREEILNIIMSKMDPGGNHALYFDTADEHPPITPASLAELDMPRIINNPKLRHDVNFDRELHFRPNLDGSKGRQKIAQADQYWKALEAELVMHALASTERMSHPGNEEHWDRISRASLVRLPKIFTAIRDILKTLVPDYDQKAVKERLDVDHIMQLIQNGVCDLIDLGNWLAKVLKNHCAPMRDQLVDNMQKEIKQGADNNEPKRLVSGLRQLMTILEAMKLDVANHQIRHMRPLLIEDTINFQQRYNAHRMAIGKISQMEAKRWLEDNLQPLGFEPSPLSAISRGLIQDLLYNDSTSFCPATFYLDSDRLRTMRVELHCRVYHAICRDVLREMAESRLSPTELENACEVLQSSVTAIVGVHGKFADRSENIAAEIVRVLLVAEGRHPPFDVGLQIIAEQKLSNCLRQDCRAFRQNAKILAETLIPKVQSRVREHVRLSALDLQDQLVPQVVPQRNSMGFGAICDPLTFGNDLMSTDPDDDIIGRFTHVIALHWQVWADLVYLVEPEREDDVASDNGSDSTIVQSQQGSPTVPVAQAVYAPGRKWLPVSVTVTDVPSGLPTPSPSPQPEEGSPPNNGDQGGEESLDSQQQQRA
ncbi:hypothetical protein M409DRAFT_69720 [Zasmidium cellare ATCC 36951]|uniref:Uncharacterized protein n=1 Tax=Zasmidium cellare ATCC 36951 TaxID=1080233 RepID=A0A6A6C5Y3_ZASCE|nr:uncharacterized protein M409DRAFT_69720 [Zasmidium cellare ATCC 36951]KAF2161668.1 hypothetical protein M409DRAFT_69720 [Zasmidium cellare ATCC 36951]